MFYYKAKNRWQAFGFHLLISLFLFIAMCTIIVVYWYPGVLFTTEGGWQGVRLIAGIDFIIGPGLTLLLYVPGKKGLKFDLTCVGILQITCIAYGMHIVNYSRPAVVAYADGIYYTTPLIRFDSRGIDISESPFLQGRMPAWVNIKLPENKKDRLKLKIKKIYKGLETSVELYEPYKKALDVLPNEGLSLEEAAEIGIKPSTTDEMRESIRIFELKTRYDSYLVAVNTKTGKFDELIGSITPEISKAMLERKLFSHDHKEGSSSQAR